MDIFSKKLRPYMPYIAKFGFVDGVRIARKLYPQQRIKDLISLNIRGYNYPIWVRRGTTDVTNFNENLIHYEFPLPEGLQPSLIIDAGANAGYASIQFLHHYPSAHVVAIEPDNSNIQILKRNCDPYNRFQAIESAVWSTSGYVRISNPDAGNTGFQVEACNEDDEGAFKSITIEEVLAQSDEDRIGILKLDIEGAEKEIFQENYQRWIDKVDVLIIELHERFKPGCALTFFNAMAHQPFKEYAKGANLVYVRNGLNTRNLPN